MVFDYEQNLTLLLLRNTKVMKDGFGQNRPPMVVTLDSIGLADVMEQ